MFFSRIQAIGPQMGGVPNEFPGSYSCHGQAEQPDAGTALTQKCWSYQTGGANTREG